jgi:4'-phosphopantetheinyl transferase
MHITRACDHPWFDLSGGRIEVWCIETAAQESVIRRLEYVLSAEERERAARFRFERHRDAFIVARGALRVLLARYIGSSAVDVTFVCGPNGKPSLPDSRVEFNVSHTDGVAVLAFAQNCALGVDIECIRPIADMMHIARRFFCRGEAQELAALPEAQRERAFFLCWTRKEAYIKATGDGLSIPLNEFRVTLREGEPARFVHIGNETSAPSGWVLHNLDISSAYAAAIAHRGEPKRVVQSPLLPAMLLVD